MAEAQWGCCGKSWERDRRGVERSFLYDDLNRLEQRIENGANGRPDSITAYEYDAAGRRLSESISAGSLEQSSSSSYDTAGRVLERVNAAGLATSYSYADGGRTTSVTRPGELTEITERFLDGRVKRVSGSGALERNYAYGVNAGGSQWSTVYSGPSGTASPLWTTTTTNMLAQSVKEERPGYEGALLTSLMRYDEKGHLLRVKTPGRAATLYGYDALINSGDRISVSRTSYALEDGEWWQLSESGMEGNTILSKSRLTGLGGSTGSGVLTAERVTIDADGRQTVSRSYTDAAKQTVTQVTDLPQAAQDAVSVSVNGLLTGSTTAGGISYTYGYDDLGRRSSVTDPRTGASLTVYNSKGQVDSTQDAAGNRTSYAYDPDTGRRTGVTDANNVSTQYDYDARGRLWKISGANVYPVEYGYDDYDRKVSMTSFREGGTGDTTT